MGDVWGCGQGRVAQGDLLCASAPHNTLPPKIASGLLPEAFAAGMYALVMYCCQRVSGHRDVAARSGVVRKCAYGHIHTYLVRAFRWLLVLCPVVLLWSSVQIALFLPGVPDNLEAFLSHTRPHRLTSRFLLPRHTCRGCAMFIARAICAQRRPSLFHSPPLHCHRCRRPWPSRSLISWILEVPTESAGSCRDLQNRLRGQIRSQALRIVNNSWL